MVATTTAAFSGRLGILQRALPTYCAPLSEALAARCQGGLSVLAGRQSPWETLETTDRPETAALEDLRNAHHRLRRPDPNHHLYGWTPPLLFNLPDDAGFAVEACRVVSHALPPYTRYLSRLPEPIWYLDCRVFSRLARPRPLTAVARPRSDGATGAGA